MIKNVVFDFGQVLIHFNPEYMCSKYLSDEDDIRLVADVLFDRIYWDRLDRGTIEDDEVVAYANDRLPPRLHKACKDIYFDWIYNLPEVSGMREVIKLCREKGYGLYLLSNISKYFAEHKHEIPILSELDGCIFSAECGYAKPSADIFDYLCKTFDLTPSETLFIDDNVNNIDGADKFGIVAYHFDGNVQTLYKFIEGLPKIK